MAKGWIRLHRQIRDNTIIWTDDPYSKAQAWIDILLRANYEDKNVMFDGKLISVKRGSFITSIRKLANEWMWDKQTVLNFLNALEKEGMVKKQSDNKKTLLIVVNYGFYQGDADTESDAEPYAESDTESPQRIHKEIQEINDDNSLDNSIKDTDKNIYSDELSKESSDRVPQQEKYQWLIDEWNTLEKLGIPKVRSIGTTGKRAQLVRARVSQFDKEAFMTAIDNIRHSDFLQGKNRSGWSIKFDWFILPSNFPKVLEGNYNNSNGLYKSNDSRLEDFV